MALPSLPAEQIDRFRRDLENLTGAAPTGLGIAISGGPDSLALLLLAHASYPGQVHAATVDHGLRPESAAEAALVASHCAALGIPHATLKIKVVAAGKGVQAGARDARYRALGEWLASAGASSLLTAHHLDDQAETFVMRLLRGSGVAGLAGIRARIPFPAAGDQACILRPVLGWRRHELADIVAHSGLETVTDASNSNEAFDRVRIRRQLAVTAWLDPEPIARSAAAMAEAEEAIEAATALLATSHIEQADGKLWLRADGISNEILRRLTLHSVRLIVPEAAPRGEQITLLVDHLRQGKKMTLAGVKCSNKGGRFLFEPAPARRS